MYSQPPAYVSGAFNTDPVAGTATNTVAIAAPGVGFVIRIVGGQIIQRNSATLGDRFLISLVDAAPVTTFWRCTLATLYENWANVLIPEPGITLMENSGLTINSVCSAATKSVGYVIYYFVDQVA